MGRIFLFAGEASAINEPVEDALLRIRNLVAAELRSRGYTVLEVPETLELAGAIAWINNRARPEDVALAIQTDAFQNPVARGASAFYIASNEERREQAEQLLQSLVRQVPSLLSRGASPDTATPLGSLAFTRQVVIPSIVLNIGFATNPTDRNLIQTRQAAIAQGIASGVAAWSQEVSGVSPTPPPPLVYPPINIRINERAYSQRGIIAEGNAYIPVDLINQLGVDLRRPISVQLLNYGNVTYIRAIDLREAGVFVGWDPTTRTVILRTAQPFNPENIGDIDAPGYLSEAQLESFLRSVNPQALEVFPEIAELYIEEATIEGISPDVAFAQALLETNFFQFGGDIQPIQNNFGGLGTVGGTGEGATFPSARIGVRAQIQHLKAYANREPLVRELVDPRFRFVTRGSAPTVEQLSNRWSADPLYGQKLLAILRRLYQSAGLL